MALDEPKDNDTKMEQDGLTFLVDNDLMKDCGNIKVDFVESGMRSGFSISSTTPVSGAGGSCSSGSCGSGCG
ncbi:MAG: hypothetical protein LC633_01420 [Desulfobulbaceae bacterium]|nr:hypothetical protein [Desulfobulbaceae bacterium]